MIATSKYYWQGIFVLAIVNSPKSLHVANEQKGRSGIHEKSRAKKLILGRRVSKVWNNRACKKRGLVKREAWGYIGHKAHEAHEYVGYEPRKAREYIWHNACRAREHVGHKVHRIQEHVRHKACRKQELVGHVINQALSMYDLQSVLYSFMSFQFSRVFVIFQRKYSASSRFKIYFCFFSYLYVSCLSNCSCSI